MREQPEKPFFGPESPKLDPPNPPEIKAWRSVAKAISWRTIGTLDTFFLSYLMITYVGPYFGLEHTQSEAATAASYIAITEVITKLFIYFFHERAWAKVQWGTLVVDGRRRETNGRSATKTATFRTIASLDTMLLAWIFTGSMATALSIGGLEIFTKMILYFIHERVWSILPFGIEHR